MKNASLLMARTLIGISVIASVVVPAAGSASAFPRTEETSATVAVADLGTTVTSTNADGDGFGWG
ncbi:hypothetical protein ABZ128_15645 [Streptomyces sp. NPDC006326]|uniref:hypothetical protein n=1 Tax=Streptomyces sp. NPDC006326 TaxID=3156752 RepID=UPI0033ADA94B